MVFHKKITATALFAFCLLPFAVFAQPGKKPPKDLEGESVDVIKDFEARLLDADKIAVTPMMPALDTATKRLDYNVPPKGIALTYAAPKLRPIAVKVDPPPPGFNGYAKVGYGIPSSPYGEVGYAVAKGKTDFKGWLRHHSANAKSLDNQRFMNNDLLLQATAQVAENTSLEGKFGYSFDDFYYFGYNHDSLDFGKEVSKQRYKNADLAFRLFNSEKTTTDLNYFAEPKFYFLKDNFASKESGFSLGLGATKWFAEKHALRLVIRPDFTTFNDTLKQTLNNVYIQPSFTLTTSFLRLKVGGNFVSHKDIFHILPDIEANLRVFGDGLVLFGGWNGDLRKNTFRTATEYNPWLGSNPNENTGFRLKNTEFKQWFGGLKGTVGPLEYSVQGGMGQANDLAFYLNDWSARQSPNGAWRRFKVIYDTTSIINFQGSARLRVAQNLFVTGSFSQSIFDPKYQLHAWHLPRTEGNFGAQLKLLEKDALTIKGNLFVADRSWYLDEEFVSQRTNAMLDLSFGGHYQATKNIGVFLDLNNLLNNRYERFHNYPTFGLNILGGITARF